MYIDSLTIAAMLVFAATTGAIIWFCMVKVCGLVNEHNDDAGSSGEKHA